MNNGDDKMTETTIINDNAYASMRGSYARKILITLEVALDPVPGWGHTAQDHIDQIFKSNPYILKATIQD
jgi:hypothetical protein